MGKNIKDKIKSGEIFDVSFSDKTKEGFFIIYHYVAEKKYYDSFTESEIVSIWKDLETGNHYGLTTELHERYFSRISKKLELVYLK